METLRQQHEPHASAARIGSPFLLRTRAEFCEWGTALAARLGVPYPVADAALSKEYWGVVSQTVGIRLNLSDIEAVSPRHVDFITNSLGTLLHEIAHPLTVAMATVAAPDGPPAQAAAIVATWADRTEPVDDPPWDDHRADYVAHCLARPPPRRATVEHAHFGRDVDGPLRATGFPASTNIPRR